MIYFGYPASCHDSVVFKASKIYRERIKYMGENGYILADKAYEIDRHIISDYLYFKIFYLGYFDKLWVATAQQWILLR
jgi:hypothetical protein